MTRKHFESLAAALLSTKPSGVYGRAVWTITVREIATVCESSNKHFDRDRFHKAAGLTY